MGMQENEVFPTIPRGGNSLIDRLARSAPAVRLENILGEAEHVQQIGKSILLLLNSPRGHARANPEFGLDAGIDSKSASAEMRSATCSQIHHAVSSFERRVKVTDVRGTASDFEDGAWCADVYFVRRESERTYIMKVRQSAPGRFELVGISGDD